MEGEWTIRAVDHRDNRITLGQAGGFLLKNDRPLLWRFSDFQCELYFNGKCKNPVNLIADLFRLETDLFRGYQSFGASLNGEIFKLLDAGHGLLAKGPKKLLEKYAQHLEEYSIDHSVINDRLPVYWDGKAYIPETRGYKIMLFGPESSYIIAKDFDLIRR